MILTDREIRTGIERKSIIIEPAPAADAYSSTSVDLTLDPNISVFNGLEQGLDTAVDLKPGVNPEALLSKLATRRVIDSLDGYRLMPRLLILAYTAEFLDLRPSFRLAARVEGKSSLARVGLGVHITAPTIHAGFQGLIRLEIINHGTYPIILRGGMPICQLIFEQTLGTPEKGYAGKFAGQRIGPLG